MLMNVLRKEQLFVNIEKCTFCTDHAVFLGFVVSVKEVQVNGENIKVIREWPKTMSEVGNFHGLASFYKRFVRNFSALVAPINEIVKRYVGFKWEKKQEQAFVALKHRLTNAPILHYQILQNLLKLNVRHLMWALGLF